MKRESKRNISKKDRKVTSSNLSKKTTTPPYNQKRFFLALIIGVIHLLGSLYFIPEKVEILKIGTSSIYFYFLSVVLTAIVFTGIYYAHLPVVKLIIKYSFLSLLLLGIFVSIIPANDLSGEQVTTYLKLLIFQNSLIVSAVFTGVLSMWQNKAKLNETIQKLYSTSNGNNKQVFFKSILVNFLNLFSKKERYTTLLFFIIVAISTIVLFYRLDHFDLYSDEAQVTQGAAGYYHTGEFKQWDFVKDKLKQGNYGRGWPHLYIMAKSYQIFGITTWSSRFPSVIFGILMSFLVYFISRYFIRDKISALFITLTVSLGYDFLLHFRWARMYAMLMPVFLLLFYFAHRLLVERNRISLLKFKENGWFNFNYTLIPVFLLFLYLSVSIHINSFLILIIVWVYVLGMAILTKEKRYILVFLLGVLFLIIGISMPSYSRHLIRFSFFETDNSDYYQHFLLSYPFKPFVSIILIAIGLGVFILIKNKRYKINILFLYTTLCIGYLIFSYILKYNVSFRYVSFIVAPVIFLVVSIYFLVIKVLFNKYIQWFLTLLLISSIILGFTSSYNRLYLKNLASPAKPSVAFKTIVDNFKKNEIVYRHWSPLLYLDDIDTSARILRVGHKKGRPFSEVYDTLKNNESGWLTWHTFLGNHIDSLVKSYANTYFTKYHGYGVDDTGVELYHYSNSMLKDTNIFKNRDIYMPTGNLNLENDYSFSFWIGKDVAFKKAFYITNNNEDVINFEFLDNKFIVSYINDSIKNSLETPLISDNNIHHIVWHQTKGELNNQISLYLDGRKINSTKLKSNFNKLVKFKINPDYRGYLNAVAIYDFVLSEDQILEIFAKSNRNTSEKLFVDGKSFETLFFWHKN